MLEILFEDNHLLALSKPPGTPTQPSESQKGSLEEDAKLWLKEKYQKPGNVYLHAIHRIDTPASGIVLFAKTSKALSRMQNQMREKEMKKIYLAWVEGLLDQEKGRLEDHLIHGEHRALIAKPSDSGAKRCTLEYHILKREKNRTLVEIELLTGRYHQIRAQFASRAHPLWGDVKYGSRLPYPSEGIALHHLELTVKHPISGEEILLKAPSALPD